MTSPYWSERPSGSGNGSNCQKFCGINRQGSGGGSGRGWQQDLSGCSDRQGGSWKYGVLQWERWNTEIIYFASFLIKNWICPHKKRTVLIKRYRVFINNFIHKDCRFLLILNRFYRSNCPRWTVALFNFYVAVHNCQYIVKIYFKYPIVWQRKMRCQNTDITSSVMRN